MFKNSFQNFRLISTIEGISFLILVFIAMPIKYLGDNPYPVKVVGMMHGILFILFCTALYQVSKKHHWKYKLSIKMFIYSLIPFGLIAIEKELEKLKR